jgi:hypothetical protein
MLSTGLECFRQGWNALARVGIPLYRVGVLSTELEFLYTELECFQHGCNEFYRVGMLSAGLECFRQCWNSFIPSRNAI